MVIASLVAAAGVTAVWLVVGRQDYALVWVDVPLLLLSPRLLDLVLAPLLAILVPFFATRPPGCAELLDHSVRQYSSGG